MNVCTDWNCRLLPGFPDQIGNAQTAAKALQTIHARSDISRFFFLPEFDPASDSATAFRIRLDRALQALKSVLPFSADLQASASVRLIPNLSDYTDLSRFYLPKTDYLPISLPITPEDWVETEIAKLARHAPFRVLLLNAHLLPIFYHEDMVKRILSLPNLACQVSFRSLTDEKTVDLILKPLLRRNVPILLGSGVNSLEKAYQFDFAFYREQAKKRFSSYESDLMFYGKQIFR